MTSREDTSAVMTRGDYADRQLAHVLTSYDDEPGLGRTHRAAWKAIATRPFMAGAFVWTGFDYRGEPRPLRWPTASSYFGIMDICGFPKAAFYIHQAQWVKDRPVLHLIPHWNWAGKEGQPTGDGDVERRDRRASLNGRLVGEQKVDPFEMNEWQVPYEPGRLEAVGKTAARSSPMRRRDDRRARALRLTPDRAALAGDGRDAVPVTVEALDARGRPVPTANLPVSFEIAGGRIIGVGNGDPNSHEPEKGDARSLYNGLAQVIVQSRGGGSGAPDAAGPPAGPQARRGADRRAPRSRAAQVRARLILPNQSHDRELSCFDCNAGLFPRPDLDWGALMRLRSARRRGRVAAAGTAAAAPPSRSATRSPA